MVTHVTLEEEFRKNSALKKDELNILKDWYSKQNHLPKIPDELLALFFHSCHYRMEPTKATIDNFFTVRTHVPEFFDFGDPTKVDIKKGKSIVHFFMLPGMTETGDRVIYVKVNNTDPSDFNFNEAIKSFHLTCDLEHYMNGSSAGFRILVDMNGMVFGHVARLHLLSMKKILYYLQEAMPVRLTGLHFINVVPFMDKILALMRPFLKKELMDTMFLHMGGVEELYKYIPKKMLPLDYGGDNPSLASLAEAEMKLRKSGLEVYAEEAKYRVDESKRAGKAKNAGDIFGVEGSFKKLDLD